MDYHSSERDSNGGVNGLQYTLGAGNSYKDELTNMIEKYARKNNCERFAIIAKTEDGKKHGQIVNVEIK